MGKQCSCAVGLGELAYSESPSAASYLSDFCYSAWNYSWS